MQSIEPRYAMMPVFLYAFEMRRLQYWQEQVRETSWMDALARYHVIARTVRDKKAMNKGLLMSMWEYASKKYDEIVDSIPDDVALSDEENQRIVNKLQSYLDIMNQVEAQL